jgi:hypothetical protein
VDEDSSEALRPCATRKVRGRVGRATAAFNHVAFEDEAKNVSPDPLATLGEGHIAYVKQIRSEDVPGLFPEAPKIAPGLKLFALHAADGTDHADRQPRSRDRQRLEQRAASGERALSATSIRRLCALQT